MGHSRCSIGDFDTAFFNGVYLLGTGCGAYCVSLECEGVGSVVCDFSGIRGCYFGTANMILVSEIVAIWRKDLNKVNPKAAESLADPEEYPNLFEDWQVALAVESKAIETRNVYPPAEQYINHADKSHITLVEAFRNMQIEEGEEHLENGDSTHELTEQNGEEHYTEEQEEQNGEEESQEEAVVVDADSTDGAVLVNGNEAEEEWGTNNEGAPSA